MHLATLFFVILVLASALAPYRQYIGLPIKNGKTILDKWKLDCKSIVNAIRKLKVIQYFLVWFFFIRDSHLFGAENLKAPALKTGISIKVVCYSSPVAKERLRIHIIDVDSFLVNAKKKNSCSGQTLLKLKPVTRSLPRR